MTTDTQKSEISKTERNYQLGNFLDEKWGSCNFIEGNPNPNVSLRKGIDPNQNDPKGQFVNELQDQMRSTNLTEPEMKMIRERLRLRTGTGGMI